MEFEEIRPYHDEELPQVFEELLLTWRSNNWLAPLCRASLLKLSRKRCVQNRPSRSFRKIFCYGIPHKLAWRYHRRTDIGEHGCAEQTVGLYLCLQSSGHYSRLRFLSVLLVEQGLDTVEIAIGDNLLIYPWIKKLVRINKCFTVQRALTMRQMLESSIPHVRYMHYTIAGKKNSLSGLPSAKGVQRFQ